MSVQRKVKKKHINIVDKNPSSQAKALRLKRVRNLGNLTRRDIEDRYGINLNTYKGWELARHGGLSRKGAKQIVEILQNNGVMCSIEWLLYGVGEKPQLIDQFEVREETAGYDTTLNNSEVDKQIIQVFKHGYKDTIDLIIDDDGMEPYYSIGEWVLGVKRFGKEIKKFVNKNCIVQTASESVMLRHLQCGNKKNVYTLTCLNPNTFVEQPVLYNVELISIAPIIWIRRREEI